MRKLNYFLAIALLMQATNAIANTTITLRVADENDAGVIAGTVEVTETKYGLLFTPNLQGLTPGVHGFHIHQYASCDKMAMAAGGHFDPQATGAHLGPYNDAGHLGDLPPLYVNADGTATAPVLAPRLHRVDEISGHALMIHQAGDNYADEPAKLGGGGARMVCGIIH